MTSDALYWASVTLFDNAPRSDVKKVAVLITDGFSFEPVKTADAALSLRVGSQEVTWRILSYCLL
jgi:hypothetical protein